MGSRSSVWGVIKHICHSWALLLCIFMKGWVSIAKLIHTPSLVEFPPAFWSDNLYLIFKEKFPFLSLFEDPFLCRPWIEIMGEAVPNSSDVRGTKTHLFVEHNKLCSVHRCASHCPFVRKRSPTRSPLPPREPRLLMWSVLRAENKTSP